MVHRLERAYVFVCVCVCGGGGVGGGVTLLGHKWE